MPWIGSNIDLSFPDIKKTVELDKLQQPQVDNYYPLAYQRRKDAMTMMNRDSFKIQNKTINNIKQAE